MLLPWSFNLFFPTNFPGYVYCTVCPRSIDPFYILTYSIKWVKAYSMFAPTMTWSMFTVALKNIFVIPEKNRKAY